MFIQINRRSTTRRAWNCMWWDPEGGQDRKRQDVVEKVRKFTMMMRATPAGSRWPAVRDLQRGHEEGHGKGKDSVCQRLDSCLREPVTQVFGFCSAHAFPEREVAHPS